MLTEFQRQVLPQLWDSSYGNGHDFGFADEITGFDPVQHGGIISGLVQAGYITVSPQRVNFEILPYMNFTEKGKELFKDFANSSELK